MTPSQSSFTTPRSLTRVAVCTLLTVTGISLLPAAGVSAGVDDDIDIEIECEFDAVDDNYSTPAGVTLQVTAPGNFGNDVDCGYELFGPLLNQPANGEVAWGSYGNFNYTPDPGFVGIDTFEYQIYYNDGDGTVVPTVENQPVTAFVTIEVTGESTPTVPTETPTTNVGGSGPTLPSTGSNTAVALVAAALCAAGVALVRPARRRRQVQL
jgi:LPXTG-motif cell wall-anchored protein